MMMRGRRGLSLMAGVFCGLILLGIPVNPGTEAGRREGTARAQGLPSEETLDDQLARLAEQIPGFGGLFLDERGRITIYLTEGEITTQSVREIGALIASTLSWDDPRLRAGEIHIRPGRYTFLQLKQWYEQFAPEALEIEGTILTDIDEARNRLRIGVESEEAGDRIRERLAHVGIPQDAVIIEEIEPIIPMATVRDKVRPLIGGVQINFPGYLCTLGFNAVREGILGFVTASHCTDVQGGVENTPYWQPLEAQDTFIGTEIADPRYQWRIGCPRGKLCRYSDSAFAQLAQGVSASLGYVARTEGVGSLVLAGSFRITAEATRRLVGETLNKVGRTTGWSQGPISQTCVTVGVAGTRIVLLCQDFVQARVDAGDSGSPVFKITNGDVTLYGVLWGGNSSGTYFVYSPIGNIQRSDELGPLKTCAVGSC